MALSNPPIYPKLVKTFNPLTTGAKTSDTNTTGGVQAFTVPSDGSVKMYRVRKVTVKPLGAVATATRQKLYRAKAANTAVLALLRDRLQPVVGTYNENVASDEKTFDYGPADFADFEPGDICYVGSGVALAAGFQWEVQVEVY